MMEYQEQLDGRIHLREEIVEKIKRKLVLHGGEE